MHELSGGDVCRSKLIFVKSCESTESSDFRHLKRVREPLSRSSSGIQGKVADVLGRRSRHSRSGHRCSGGEPSTYIMVLFSLQGYYNIYTWLYN
jgi:hypothetical protein